MQFLVRYVGLDLQSTQLRQQPNLVLEKKNPWAANEMAQGANSFVTTSDDLLLSLTFRTHNEKTKLTFPIKLPLSLHVPSPNTHTKQRLYHTKEVMWPSMVMYNFVSSTQKTETSEFKASLVYKEVPGQLGVHREIPPKKKRGNLGRSQFSPSIWVPRIILRSSGLEADAFTQLCHCAGSKVSFFFFLV